MYNYILCFSKNFENYFQKHNINMNKYMFNFVNFEI